MELNTSIPQDWEQPKYWLGQRTQQGLIIGVQYNPADTVFASMCGEGWRYILLKSKKSEEVETYFDDGLQLLSANELQQALQAELLQHQRRITAIQEQLTAITRFSGG